MLEVAIKESVDCVVLLRRNVFEKFQIPNEKFWNRKFSVFLLKKNDIKGEMSRRKQPRPYRLQDDEDEKQNNIRANNSSPPLNLVNGNGVQKQNRKFRIFLLFFFKNFDTKSS